MGFLSVAGVTALHQSPSLSTRLDNLRSNDEQIRLSAGRSLPYAWEAAPDRRALVEQIIPLLSSSDQHVKLAVLTTLEQIGLLHPDGAPVFAKSKQASLQPTEAPLFDFRQYATTVPDITRGPPPAHLPN